MGLSIRPKTLKGQLKLVFIVVGSVFLALASIVLYRNGESALRRRLIANAETATETAGSLVSVQDHRSIRSAEDMNSTAFREIVTDLSALRRANPSITHLFTLSPVGQLGSWGVIVDMGGTAPDRRGVELVRGRLPIGSSPPQNVPADLIREGMSGTASRIIDFPDPDRARVVAIAPIRGENGVSTGLAVVELSAAELIEETQSLLLLSIAIFLVGLVVSGLFITTIIALFVLFLGSLISGIYLWETLSIKGFASITAVIVLSSLGLQGLMFIVMGRVNHPRIVGVLGGFLNVIFFFPSGAIYPVESFPLWLRAFSTVNPERYSVHAISSLLFKGAGLSSLYGDLLFLAAFAAFSIGLGTALFKRSL